MQNHLFSPYRLRSIEFRNRIVVSPMCQYSSTDGFANDWHLVHLGSRAVGGAGMVMSEAAAVEARGRISPADLGIYNDGHIEMLRRITDFIKGQGAVAGIQLAHAGRKASTKRPWEQRPPTVQPQEGGWTPVAPSAVAFNESYPQPRELSKAEIGEIVENFVAAARRARQAGFQVAEVHAAHGYLLHNFLSPVSNRRTDEYGGSFENRVRLILEIVAAVRAEWQDLPLWVRVSATDWLENNPEVSESWQLQDTIELCKKLRELGVDLIDVSSGGASPLQKIKVEPGYQVGFAAAIRQEANIPTAAVGMITEPQQAEEIIRSGQADMVALARAMLRDPYWSNHAALELEAEPYFPPQYERAK
jgi:2,4-dienoyl-CoA reductase-like NADH-dependent reductase (Old Yellow Enzyme family)